MPAISVIIPTCNRAAMLDKAIDALVRTTATPFEVIVVDGASSDSTPAVLAKWKEALGQRMVVVQETKREGFTRAVNKGFRAASSEYVTWLNDDARPLAGALDFAREQLAEAPLSVGLLAMFHRCETRMNIAYTAIRHGREFKLLHVRGTLYANFAFARRSTLEKLNYFDEGFFIHGADPDLSLKIWHSGLRVVPAFQSLIDHDEAADERRAMDAGQGARDNARLFTKWKLPPKNMAVNDFDPAHPCTMRGLQS
ncbi:MAG TPA: glycosyltransferase [Phycisphaerae bacterium]|jgi:GT2 family glycosyltransferase